MVTQSIDPCSFMMGRKLKCLKSLEKNKKNLRKFHDVQDLIMTLTTAFSSLLIKILEQREPKGVISGRIRNKTGHGRTLISI